MTPLVSFCFRRKILFQIAVALALGSNAFGLCGAPFADNMVLQRDMPIPVWGRANPDATVKVIFAGQEKSTRADKKGGWSLRLDALPASSEGREMIVDDGERRIFRNVVVGEVWVCSGQSNMAYAVKDSANAEKEIAEAGDPDIRLVGNDFTKGWRICGPDTVGDFSAVAYSFARELRRQLKVPVGLVSVSVGGTMALSWTPLKVLQGQRELWDAGVKRLDQRYAREAVVRRKAASRQPEEQAPLPPWNEYVNKKMGALFEGLVRKAVPYAVRGVLWYQGEADARHPDEYAKIFPALIRGWRGEWGQADLPFLFVQLPNYDSPNASTWVRQREVQAQALSLPRTGMAVTIDVGEANDLHPKNKQAVGRRLALIALHDVYGKELVATGPAYESFAAEDGKIRIRFRKSASGLKLNTSVGFEISAADRKFVPAEVSVEGGELVVWSEAVTEPVAVRYAWDDAPQASLFNEADLPAAPFRTDDWAPESEGPVYRGFARESGKIRLKFFPSSLALKLEGKASRGFQIAGADKKFVPARVEIDGPEIVVWAEGIPNPEAVRYAWGADEKDNNLFDEKGQAALPFRTDDWPVDTF